MPFLWFLQQLIVHSRNWECKQTIRTREVQKEKKNTPLLPWQFYEHNALWIITSFQLIINNAEKRSLTSLEKRIFLIKEIQATTDSLKQPRSWDIFRFLMVHFTSLRLRSYDFSFFFFFGFFLRFTSGATPADCTDVSMAAKPFRYLKNRNSSRWVPHRTEKYCNHPGNRNRTSSTNCSCKWCLIPLRVWEPLNTKRGNIYRISEAIAFQTQTTC